MRTPLLRALLAEAYIAALVTAIFYSPKIVGEIEGPMVVIPIAMLSLFVLSASVMAYLFCYEPLALYLDGEKKRAVRFFLETVGSFAVITALLFVGLFIYSIFV